MKIPLTNSDEYALVDADDCERLGLDKLNWQLHPKGYIYRVGMLMHREIMGLKKGDGKLVDHRNRDKKDNRKINLRVCNYGQNNANQPACAANKSSRHRGVSFNKMLDGRGNKAWYGRVKKDGKNYSTKNFWTEAEAIAARDALALKLHGEFAVVGERAKRAA